MNELYDELDKLNEISKRSGVHNMDREQCFAEISINKCAALKDKNCYECSFYKSKSSQIAENIKQMQSYRGLIPRQSLKTLVGQARAGDLEGARKGFARLKKMNGL